jgi:murein DD-endopeptidase MepM/ murein hydrolase activator NlpD
VPDRRRLILLVVLAAVAAALGVPGALGSTAWERKQELDNQIAATRDEIASAKEKEGVLSTEIDAATDEIGALQGQIGDLSARVAALESELAAHRARLERLKERYREQTRTLERLKAEHRVAQKRLETRVVELYETNEIDAVAILLEAGSLAGLIDQFEYLNEIGRQDQEIVARIAGLKVDMRRARARTAATKAKVARTTAVLAEKTAEQRAARDALLAREQALAAAQANKRELLAGVREDRHEAEEDLDAMLAASAELAATIQAAQGSSNTGGGGGGPPSASGFIWPVNGTLTSGFGWRWGRMHEGIDIAAPAGTPIRAAAAGAVIYAGWMGGYGNLTIIDHGGGIATAYAHQSAIYVGGGSVSQGQTIGAVGTTGSSTGNHLHFEVRVNGTPVDPLGYL